MRSWKTCSLLLALALLFGCVENMQRAQEIAAQNLYQEVVYQNASQPGPSVLVLPGKITCPSYEFLSRITADNLREYGEIELGKANFTVLEKDSQPEIYKEIEIAANLGDGSMAKRFKKLKAEPPQWIVMFDVTDVATNTTAFHFTDKNTSEFAGALMGGMLLGKDGAQIGEAALGSINAAKEQRQWNITLRYRILEGATGKEVSQGEFTEQAKIDRELKGFLGFDASEAGGLSLSTVSQRLVQKAVQDIDKRYKSDAAATAVADAGETAAQKTAPSKEISLKEQVKRLQDAPDLACEEKRLGGFVCRMPTAWSLGDPPTAKQVAFAKKPELAKLYEQRRKDGKASIVDSVVEFDIIRTAGPLVTLTEPGSTLSELGKAATLDGKDVEGRVILLPGAAAKLPPETLTTAVLGHLGRVCVLERLAVETVSAKDGTQRPVAVYKYIEVERTRTEEATNSDDERRKKYGFIATPHYNTMAMSVIPKGDDLLLVIMISPENRFLPQLEGFKKLVESAV